MTTQEQTAKTPAEQDALTVLVDWRKHDKAALGDKRSRDAQRSEYYARNNLRNAADKLEGER